MTYEINDDVYPFSSVTLIVSYWGGEGYVGSGALVGPNDVLTASHVVYDQSLGGFADEVRIYPSFDIKDGPFQTYYSPVRWKYTTNFDPDGDGLLVSSGPGFEGSEIDIALLTLDKNVGNAQGYFGLDPNFVSGNVSVVGYPAIHGLKPMYDEGYAVKHPYENFIEVSQLELSGGNSGGPLYYMSTQGPIAVGVVSTASWITSLNAHWEWITEELNSNNILAIDPTYNVVAFNSEVNEGETANFRIETSGLINGYILPYYITGISVDDISKNNLAGKVRVDENGQAFLSFTTTADQITEGIENLTLNVSGSSARIQIFDTSQSSSVRTENYSNGDIYVGEFKDGLRDGEGTYTFSDDSKYIGQWTDGEMDGEGVFTYTSSGDRYVGQWLKGEKYGEGVYTFSNGDEYSGEWKNGVFEGEGIYTYANGEKYVGKWLNGKKNGEGTYFFVNGEKKIGNWIDGEFIDSKIIETINYSMGDIYVGETIDGIRNGDGTYTYASGDEYVGEFKDGNFHGQGTYTFADGDKYVGEYKDDLRNGEGVYSFASGDKYVGEWIDGEYHGQGTFTFADGVNYVGEFKNYKYDGQGIYTWVSGDKYEGEFQDDLRNGQGTFNFANGDKYVGQWLNDYLHGQGTYSFADGENYVGDFVNDKYDGIGTYTFASGSKYFGEWKEGEYNGSGTYIASNGDNYTGSFTNNFFHGQGTYTFANGDQFIGEFVNDKYHGQFTVSYSNGDKYVGEYKDDLRNGEGVYSFASGDKYVGEWIDGEYHGKGIYTFADGSEKSGFWSSGEFVDSLDVSVFIESEENQTFIADENQTSLTIMGVKNNYVFKKIGNGTSWEISNSDIGTDTLSGFKRLEFTDGTLALDVDAGDTAGQAYRLYQAAFARTPDMSGVSYHMNDMEANGLVLENVANNFIASPEFKTKYGDSPSDDVFIDLLYQNVLGRSADDDGLTFYKNHFNEGTMTRAAALIGFAESPENVSLVAPQIEDGIWLAS